MLILMCIFTNFFSKFKSMNNGLTNGQEVLAFGENQLCRQFIAREEK